MSANRKMNAAMKGSLSCEDSGMEEYIMKLVPLGDRVVIKALVAEETTKSGIVLPMDRLRRSHSRQRLLL